MSTLSEHIIAARIPGFPSVINGVARTYLPLNVVNHSVTLDDSWTPYAQTQLVCTLPASAHRTFLVPGQTRRVTFELVQRFEDWNSFGYRETVTRSFDLLLTSRTFDYNKGTMTLTLESDEALLRQRGLGSTNPERTAGLSIKAAVNLALGKAGFALQPGAVDANLQGNETPEIVATNLALNPLGISGTGWATSTNVTVVNSSSSAPVWTHKAGGNGNAYFTIPIAAMRAGRTYRARIELSMVSGTAPAGFNVYRAGTLPFAGLGVMTNSGGRWSWEGSFTAAADSAAPQLWVDVVGIGTGERYTLANLVLVEETTSTAPLGTAFDGSSVTSGGFTYSWTGTLYASASNRIAQIGTMNRATTWEPDMTAWEYLTPLLQAGNLRLYCDEQRRWYLEESGSERDGMVFIGEGQNVLAATDTISAFEDESPSFTGVVIKYRDDRYDIAGSPQSVRRIEFDRPYPGPGAAGFILARAAERGRVYTLEANCDYTVTPGQNIVATLPGTPVQTGNITRVTWSGPSNRMTIASRGLTSTPPLSWAVATKTWATVPGTWATYSG